MEKEDLVRENQWLKVYRVGDKGLRYESKCLSEGLQLSARLLKSEWKKLSAEERLDFTIAFGAIEKLSSEDEEILSFLMESGDDAVLSNLASQYAKHSDRERVLPFLLSRIRRRTQTRGNFFQALELLGDVRAVPGLKRSFDEYRAALAKGQLDQDQMLDYLQCCRSLMILDGSPAFRGAIENTLRGPDELIRRRAAQLLGSGGLGIRI